MKTWTIAAVAVITAVVLAAPAAADGADDQYLTTLNQLGLASFRESRY